MNPRPSTPLQNSGKAAPSADNALAESFNATLKRETLHGASCWPNAATCRREVFRWVSGQRGSLQGLASGHPDGYPSQVSKVLLTV